MRWGLWTLAARAARGPCRWVDPRKGCHSVGGCLDPNPPLRFVESKSSLQSAHLGHLLSVALPPAESPRPRRTQPRRRADVRPLLSQPLHAPEQRCPGPGLRGHHLRAQLRPRPLRHRRDPNQRPFQQPRPPEPHGAPRPAPGPQRPSASAQRPPLRGAAGPRARALVPR
jgi:hypothetical protein